MKNTHALIATAVSSLFILGASSSTALAAAANMEKCAGIVKAGKNDCQTASSSCAGSAKKDNQKDAWVYLPKGSCEKIVGGHVLASKKK